MNTTEAKKFPSDIEIARSTTLEPITKIAQKVGIQEEQVIPYGKHMAKVPLELISQDKIDQSNLILVTSITPTKAGIGKTTVSIGLALGLNKIGKKAVVALREPSLGPCFGMKGGAAGGGHAQVLPMENINLHFTGDFHAITSAHNMITALLDNYNYHNRGTDKVLKEVLWKRVLDVNDRNLRNITTGLGGSANGVPQESGFDITPASEIMAILCLSQDLDDLRRRIENILLGYKADGSMFTIKDLGVAGAITVLLKDALNPNLVQTTENTAAFIHGGPFANIAHGCNSVIATKMAMSHADYVITEAGFGADLGAEKFFDIKCRKAGLNPKLTVIVVTAQGLKMHGGVSINEIKQPNKLGIIKGLDNLKKHIQNIRSYGQSIVIAFNKYNTDSEEEIEIIQDFCKRCEVGFALNDAFTKGGDGAMKFAELVVSMIEEKPSEKLKFVYEDHDPIKVKVEKIAKNIYGAASVNFSPQALIKIKKIQETDMNNFPVCIAKTQYSFSADPKAYGVAHDFEFQISDIVINRGAEFIVVLAGDIMRMPGLPKEPQALHIDFKNGQIEGLS
ncbi:formate--tetrahydrofolate ligase [Chryseobacterium sp.]|uniref:formate--tetrahydrofolate ligase n=1 Tax=Chryseobacterium sp. TaxID=1871047 RepID=UPI0025B91304|nr:formate--tetrahydrofolate ligase [Chryseobacterium sp.]